MYYKIKIPVVTTGTVPGRLARNLLEKEDAPATNQGEVGAGSVCLLP